MRLPATLLAAGAALVLAACSDSPSGVVPSAPQAAINAVPPSATASPASYSQFAGSLAKTETGLPLDVSQVVAPTSETEAPIPVI
jgi:hypothetical protein